MPSENVEAFHRAIEAVGRGDADAAIAETHPEVVLEAQRSPTEGTFVGPEGIRRFMEDTAETFGIFEPRFPEIRERGDAVIAIGTIKIRAVRGELETEIPSAMVVRFRGGKIIHLKDHVERAPAEEALGEEAAPPPAFVHRLRVRYAECDMQGQVFNAHYLTWFDTAHTEWIRSVYGKYEDIVGLGVEFVVAEANVRYRAPARFDDDLEVHVAPDPMGETSLTSRFEVRRGEDLLAEGWIRHVCVDAEHWAKTPWPDAIRAALTA